MDQSSSKNFSLISKAQLGVTGLATGIAGFTAYQIYKQNKDREKKERIVSYLKSRINPRTLRVENTPGNNNIANFGMVGAAGGLVASTAAFIGLDKAIEHLTSEEFKAKRKIKKAYDEKYEKWYKEEVLNVENGLLSADDFIIKKNKMKDYFNKQSEIAYAKWKKREEFIEEASKNFYSKLQEKVPKNFSFLNLNNKNNTIKNNVVMEPDVSGFIRLDAARTFLNKGTKVFLNVLNKDDKIKDAAKRLFLIEIEIDTMKNISLEKKELLKFDAFKSILSEFKNSTDVEKIFKLKSKYEKKYKLLNNNNNNNNKIKGSNINFENILDDSDFKGWKEEFNI